MSRLRRGRARYPGFRSLLSDGAGIILVEVVIAAVLVGLVAVPLGVAFSGAVERARVARQAETSAAGEAEGVSADPGGAWDWGPKIASAWWLPGPVLHVRVANAGGGEAVNIVVGLWADGWLVGTVAADGRSGRVSAGELSVGTRTWSGLAGSELVVRARAGDGAWGAPWRLTVPELAGDSPTPGSLGPAVTSGPSVVAHRSETGVSPLTVSWSAVSLASPPFGLLFLLDPAVLGWGGASLDGRSQWWWMEEGRSVDVYF
jgi:hypothetical protein